MAATQRNYLEEQRTGAQAGADQATRDAEDLSPGASRRAADWTWASFVLIGG